MWKLEREYDEFSKTLYLCLIDNIIIENNCWTFDLMYCCEYGEINAMLSVIIRNIEKNKHKFNPYDTIDISVDGEVHSLKNLLLYDKVKIAENGYNAVNAWYPIKLEILKILFSDKKINIRVKTNLGFHSFPLSVENKYCLKAFYDEYKNELLFV